MAYESDPGEAINAMLAANPSTRAEIWRETIDLLEQNPAAYVYTDTFVEPLSDDRGLRTLWQFHAYSLDRDEWSHVAVQGDTPASSLPRDIGKALRHAYGIQELTTRDKRRGLLGVKATQFCGIAVHFPEDKLLGAIKREMPQQVRQLTVQTRQGVRGADPEALRSVPPIDVVVRLNHPNEDPGFLGGADSNADYAALAEANGTIERLLPNFVPGTVTFRIV